MNISRPFILRPVATTLLTLGLVLAGMVAFRLLPVAPLPQVEFPTIFVQASMPGASPETMATSVATPLERHLGQIADVTEMTSSSSLGSTQIVLQFGLNRSIEGAARDVQAAINAARVDLPVALKSNPTYRKINPANAPMMILSLTSPTRTPGQLYDSAASILQQKLSQVEGVGQVSIGGASLPAVRVEINPDTLFKYGIGLEDVRAALAAANANGPKGALEHGALRYQIYVNDQARKADDYRNLIIAYRKGAAVRLSDVAEVQDSVEDLRNRGLANGKPAVMLVISRQHGANVIETADRVKALLPMLRAAVPNDIDVELVADNTTTIRASLRDVQHTLMIAIGLVILVVFLFLRDIRATVIPSVAVSVSLVGTFGVMYVLGYSLDNLSLMALTVATGFVVDDAIVVLENISRHIENGESRLQAALKGAKEVSFTVVSMSLSLVAVFIPILLMGGLMGRFFREFAVTLSVAIMVSLVVSLTTTPMMCAFLMRDRKAAAEKGEKPPGRLARWLERGFEAMKMAYARSLGVALRHSVLTMLVLAATIGLNVYLYSAIPKGFLPQQDTGRMVGGIRGDQTISFQSMKEKLAQFIDLIKTDPAVENVVGFTGGGRTNSGFVFVTLKPVAERDVTVDQVIGRLRGKLNRVAGATMFLQAVQDIRAGGRQSDSQYQYTLQSDSLEELETWAPKVVEALQGIPEVADVNSDRQAKGLEIQVTMDRDLAARLGLSVSQVSNALYDSFGQRQVSTIYNPLNQYHVIMEVASKWQQNPDSIRDIYVATSGKAVTGAQATNSVVQVTNTTTAKRPAPPSSGNPPSGGGDSASASAVSNQRANQIGTARGAVSTGRAVSTGASTMVPLTAVANYGPSSTPVSVNHQGAFVAVTISFNITPGVSLSQASAAIDEAMNRIGVPATVHGSFQGTAKAFKSEGGNQVILIIAALLAVYIVLGILYESYMHPITIISTLPSAGVGAVLALMLFRTEFGIIAVIGVILLIGIVKKNAIMMIDFALDAERSRGLSPREAIFEACILRFRPILMTTMAAMLGALPLALGHGEGAELRQPLGIAIVGGLVLSQILTLYTTPVVYLHLDRLRLLMTRRRHRSTAPGNAPA